MEFGNVFESDDTGMSNTFNEISIPLPYIASNDKTNALDVQIKMCKLEGELVSAPVPEKKGR